MHQLLISVVTNKQYYLSFKRMKDMSKININDVDDFFEDEDKPERIAREDHVSHKRKTQNRRKIEYLLERKKLREMLYTDDSYWGD